jgi:predicted nucleic acid-binding protein
VHVLVDTNVFISDFLMTGNPFRILLNECRAGRMFLVISNVVEQEVVNIYREHLRGYLAKAKNVYSKLGSCYGIDAAVPDLPGLEDAVKVYAQRLRGAVREVGACPLATRRSLIK